MVWNIPLLKTYLAVDEENGSKQLVSGRFTSKWNEEKQKTKQNRAASFANHDYDTNPWPLLPCSELQKEHLFPFPQLSQTKKTATESPRDFSWAEGEIRYFS